MSQVLTVTAWLMNQTVIVSLLSWLKSIKGPRFIGEAAFSMNSSFYRNLTGDMRY